MKKRLIVLISLALVAVFAMAACTPGEIKPKGDKMTEEQVGEYYEELSKKLAEKENEMPESNWYRLSMHVSMELKNSDKKDDYMTAEISVSGKHYNTPIVFEEKYTYDFSMKIVVSSKDDNENVDVFTTTLRGKFFKVEGEVYAEITAKVEGDDMKSEIKAKLNARGFRSMTQYIENNSYGTDITTLASGMLFDPRIIIEDLNEEGEFYKFKNGFSMVNKSEADTETLNGTYWNKTNNVQVVEFDKDMNVAKISGYMSNENSVGTSKSKTVASIEVKKTSAGANVKTPENPNEYESNFNIN